MTDKALQYHRQNYSVACHHRTWDHPANGCPGLQDIEFVEISQEVLERFYKPVMNSRRFNWSNCI